jgi:hypothetical protein
LTPPRSGTAPANENALARNGWATAGNRFRSAATEGKLAATVEEDSPMSTLPRPLALTDAQYFAICQAVEPLAPADRSRFLGELAGLLRSEREIRDGTINAAVRFLLRKYFRPPDVPRQTAVHHTKNLGPAIE